MMVPVTLFASPQNPFHHLAIHIRQAEVAALEAVGEAFVVEA